MPILNVADIVTHRQVAENTFFDTCNLINNTLSYESTYGDEIFIQTVISGVSCGFENGRYFDKIKQNLFQTEVDAILRLPSNTTISGIDQIQMTKKNLVSIDPITYDIEGEPQIGKTCIIVGLKSVE